MKLFISKGIEDPSKIREALENGVIDPDNFKKNRGKKA